MPEQLEENQNELIDQIEGKEAVEDTDAVETSKMPEFDRLKKSTDKVVDKENESVDKNLQLYDLTTVESEEDLSDIDFVAFKTELKKQLKKVEKVEDFQTFLTNYLPVLQKLRGIAKNLNSEHKILDSALAGFETEKESLDYDNFQDKTRYKKKGFFGKISSMPIRFLQKRRYKKARKKLDKDRYPLSRSVDRLEAELTYRSYGIGEYLEKLELKIKDLIVREIAKSAWEIREKYLRMIHDIEVDSSFKEELGLSEEDSLAFLNLMIRADAESQINKLVEKIKNSELEDEIKNWALRNIKETLDPFGDSYPRDPYKNNDSGDMRPITTFIKFDKYNKDRDEDINAIQNYNEKKQNILNETLEIILSNSELSKKFDLEYFKERISQKFIETLLFLDDNSEITVGLQKYLFTLAQHNSAIKMKYARYILMNAWRAAYKDHRGSGRKEIVHPFIPKKDKYFKGKESELYKFIDSFSEAELAKLEPEMQEIFALIKQDPNRFYHGQSNYLAKAGTRLAKLNDSDVRNNPEMHSYNTSNQQNQIRTEWLVQDYAEKFGMQDEEAKAELKDYLDNGVLDEKILARMEDLFEKGSPSSHVCFPSLERYKIQRDLLSLVLKMLATQDENKQKFALGLFKNLELVELGSETDEIIRKILLESKNQSLQVKLFEAILEQGRDTQAALALLRYIPQMSDVEVTVTEYNGKISDWETRLEATKARKLLDKKNIFKLFVICLKGDDLSDDDFTHLSVALGKDEESVKETFKFIKGLHNLYARDLNDLIRYKIGDKPEEVMDELFNFPNKQQILELVRDLKEVCGYDFYLGYVDTLNTWLSRKDWVIKNITQIRDITGYKWNADVPVMDRILNNIDQNPDLLDFLAFLSSNAYEFNSDHLPTINKLMNAKHSFQIIFEKIKEIYPDYKVESRKLKDYLKLAEEFKLNLSNEEGIEIEEDILSLIKELKKYGYSFFVDHIDHLKEFLETENKDKLIDFIAELSSFGYTIHIYDLCKLDRGSSLIEKLILSKDTILKDLKEIRKVFPDFQYQFNQGALKDNMPYAVWKRKIGSYLKGFEQELNTDITVSTIKLVERDDWYKWLCLFVAVEMGELNVTKVLKSNLKEIFSNEENMNFCLQEFIKEWKAFLKGEDDFSFKSNILNSVIEYCGGAGHLRHVESLASLMYQVKEMNFKASTVEKTKIEFKESFLRQEIKFQKEGWSDKDKTEFYDISTAIILAAPSLYTSFQELMELMDKETMKSFSKELLPLYQAQLVIIQKNDKHNSRDLVSVRKPIKDLAKKLRGLNKPTEIKNLLKAEKQRLVDEIKSRFKERFGILESPLTFDAEKIRTLQNFVRYLGNLNDADKDKDKEYILALLLSLKLEGEWDKFRRGESIDISTRFKGEQLRFLQEILVDKDKNNIVTADYLGIDSEEIAKLQELLQEDVVSIIRGKIETIDLKLGNILRNLEELRDPDIYTEENEKKLVNLVIELGDESMLINPVLAKTFQQLNGRNLELSEEEQHVQDKLKEVFDLSSIENVKSIQTSFRLVGLVEKSLNKLDVSRIRTEISNLEKKLIPSQAIIDIVNRITDEEFSTDSGALALSQDVMYLESLFSKKQDELSEKEKEVLDDYLNSIKDQILKLEEILEEMKEFYPNLKKAVSKSKNESLIRRVDEINDVICKQADVAQQFVTNVTGDINLVIENIRACLSCMNKECNNDTNLSFADSNRFFITSQGVSEKGSFADELVFLLPVKSESGEQELSFVMDRVYGQRVSDVLVGHVVGVYKKYTKIKKEFPDAKLSIFVTNAALTSVGVSAEIFMKRLKEHIDNDISDEVKTMTVKIPESSFGDYYVEFGASGGSRSKGDSNISGLVIK